NDLERGVPRRDLAVQLCTICVRRVLETMRQLHNAGAAIRAGKIQVAPADRLPDGAGHVVRADIALELWWRVRAAVGVPAPTDGGMAVFLRSRGAAEQQRLCVGRRGHPRGAIARLPSTFAQPLGPAHARGRGEVAPRIMGAARAVAV